MREPIGLLIKRLKNDCERKVKYWLNPIIQDKNRGFKDYELRTIAKLIEDNREILLEAWNDYFDIGS